MARAPCALAHLRPVGTLRWHHDISDDSEVLSRQHNEEMYKKGSYSILAYELLVNWLLERTAAGLVGDHLRLSIEAGYIDGIFGAALGYDRAAAMRDLAVGLAKFLGFDVASKKIADPTSQMAVLGASLTLHTWILALDPDKALSYEAQVSEALTRKSSMRMADFLSLTCKLVHAAQYRPAGRPYLTCMFTAMRQATRSGAKHVRLGRGVMCDLRW